MVIQNNCNFVVNAAAPIVSKVFPNPQGDVLTLEVEGNGKFILEGSLRTDGQWFPLTGINITTLTPVKEYFTESGLYQIDMTGVRFVRAKVESVNGTVSLIGQIVSTTEV